MLCRIFDNINDRRVKDTPNDADDLFDVHNKNPKGGTVKDFCTAFSEISLTHGFSKAATNDVLKLLRDITSSLKIPLSGKSVTSNTGDVTTNKLSAYMDDDEKGWL